MPLCGFNKKMIDGLRQFGEGLYEQAEKRAAEDGVSLRTSFENEVEEMDFFLQILSENSNRLQGLIGVTNLAQFLYRNVQGLEQPKEQFLKGSEKLLAFLVKMDDKYYKELRPGVNPTHALTKLGEWIEQNLPSTNPSDTATIV